MAILPTVEIPGLREAIRRERTLRDRAFLGGDELVCGVVVRQLSLRIMLFLEHAQNGFLIPVRWDFAEEPIAHAVQVLWFARKEWTPPSVAPDGFWKQLKEEIRVQKFMRKVLSGRDGVALVKEVRDWIDEATFDCPAGGGSEIPRQSYASHPAHLVDLFGAAGLPFSYDEIMDMPLKRLWQHWRLAANRMYGVKLTNPSDEVATGYLSTGRAHEHRN